MVSVIVGGARDRWRWVILAIYLSLADENSLQTEWESLDIVSAPLPSTHTHQNQAGTAVGTQQAANPLQSASMTMTNAAASIASIFRGLTGR